jgi:hypothetical protein
MKNVYGENSVIGTRVCSVDLNGVVHDRPCLGLFQGTQEGVILFAKTYYFSGEELIVIAQNQVKDTFYLGHLSSK